MIPFLLAGTLAPPLLPGNDAMDLIFASHWIYPARAPVLQEVDVKCVEKKINEALQGKCYDELALWSNHRRIGFPIHTPWYTTRL